MQHAPLKTERTTCSNEQYNILCAGSMQRSILTCNAASNVQRSILTCNVQLTKARLRQAPDQRAKPKIEANTKVDAAKLREQLLVPIRSQLSTHGPNEQPCEHAPAELECSHVAPLVPWGALK